MVPIIAPDILDVETLQETLDAQVSKVFDGDGFLARVWNPLRRAWVDRVPFRFAFIDAPEIGQPQGAESREFLTNLIYGKALQLSPIGKESTGYMPIDPYKRMLCMGFLTEQIQMGKIEYFFDGKYGVGRLNTPRPVVRNVELEMLINGWAWVIKQYTFEREQEYFEAQSNAQRNRRGLWAFDDPEPPWVFKQRQKRGRKAAEGQPNLFSGAIAVCPVEDCGGHLVERQGRHGVFIGCTNFPRCRHSQTGAV